jgi:hypothetical protein
MKTVWLIPAFFAIVACSGAPVMSPKTTAVDAAPRRGWALGPADGRLYDGDGAPIARCEAPASCVSVGPDARFIAACEANGFKAVDCGCNAACTGPVKVARARTNDLALP